MSISCYDLLSLRYFQNIKLVTGKKGLCHQVTWPFICTTPTVSQWLHGGELLFITGAGLDIDEASLANLLEECISKELAGIVIVTGSKYIQSIPPLLIKLADKADFPLFEMSWNIKLIDVTQEISEYIMQHKEVFRQSQRFLERLLFSDDEMSNFDELSDLYSIPNRPYHFTSVIHIESPDELYDNLGFVKNDIIHTLANHCNDKTTSLVSMNSGNSIICFSSADSEKYINRVSEKILSVFHMMRTRYNGMTLRLGIGRIYKEGDSSKIQTSFREAQRAIKLMKKDIFNINVLRYSELGIYKLLYEIKNTNEIRTYYQEKIGSLIESDLKNSTELLPTLRTYLNNNCNLVSTAQAMFIHRNTLVYRLNTIKNLLQTDLNDPQVRHELFNSIMVYDFLEKN